MVYFVFFVDFDDLFLLRFFFVCEDYLLDGHLTVFVHHFHFSTTIVTVVTTVVDLNVLTSFLHFCLLELLFYSEYVISLFRIEHSRSEKTYVCFWAGVISSPFQNRLV